jgi:hypothetical protein
MISGMKKTIPLLFSKIYIALCTFVALLYGQYAFAQEVTAGKDSIQGYLLLIMEFINDVVLPLLFSIALLFFLVNAARYFIIEGSDSASREKARTLALYGIGAFVFLVSIWGIVNMFVGGFGLRNQIICPDYLEENNDCGTFFNPMPKDIQQWGDFI